MTNILLKYIEKKYGSTNTALARSACGSVAAIIGTIFNIFLFAIKIIAGILSGSVAITADAINNLSDASSSIVTIVGFKMAERPADEDHPYGHARIEYIAGLIVALMILLIGFELLKSSFDKILHPSLPTYSFLTLAILIVSIFIKLYMSIFYNVIGTKIQSTTLKATGIDSRNDVLSTLGVLISALIGYFTNLPIDGYAGLLVAIFILYSGVNIVKDTIDPILGAAPDPDLIKNIQDEILAVPQIQGVHDFIIHDYGPGRRFATAHVEINATDDVITSHDIIDDIERKIKEDLNVLLVLHYDPIVMDNEQVNLARYMVKNIIHNISDGLSFHDFRMVSGPTHTNLIFDVAMPFNFKMSSDELSKEIDRQVKLVDEKYFTVITIDKGGFAE